MNDIVVIKDTNISSSDSLAESFVKCTMLELGEISQKFFKIGARLYEAQKSKYYEELGFENITDCAEHYFGFKKTTTYDLIAIYEFCSGFEKYSKTVMVLSDKYKGYSQSQLAVISSINYARDAFFVLCSPTDTVSSLKKAKKYWHEYHNKYSFPHSILGGSHSINEFIDKVEEHKSFSVAIDNLESALKNNVDSQESIIIEGEFNDLSDAPYENGSSAQTENGSVGSSARDEEPKSIEAADVSSMELCDIFDNYEFFEDMLKKFFIKFFNDSSYSVMFDPDDKGLGIRVLPDSFREMFVVILRRFFKKNSTEIKIKLQEMIWNHFKGYDYKLELNGRGHSIKTFIGVIVGYLVNEFIYFKKEEDDNG